MNLVSLSCNRLGHSPSAACSKHHRLNHAPFGRREIIVSELQMQNPCVREFCGQFRFKCLDAE